MVYDEAVKKINSLLKFGVKPGLKNIKKLLSYMGSPQKKLKFIHVAGTNGKGSICSLTSSILSNSGYKTGLFLSPYVIDFRERIQFNGNMISKDELVLMLKKVLPFVESMHNNGKFITEFELITAIAFEYFLYKCCDVVVLEVGLGGRFDATNVIEESIATIIGSISMEHTQILGDTIEKIALEKCGIIKDKGNTIIYPNQEDCVYNIIYKTCREKSNNIIIPTIDDIKILDMSILGTKFNYKGLTLHLPLLGEHQIKNTLVVLSTIDVLKKQSFYISNDDIIRGISKVQHPARMEVLSQNPLILLDGAHNVDGMKSLSIAIEYYLKRKNIIGIMGMLKDKDIKNSIREVVPLFNHLFTVTPNNMRALSSNKLAVEAQNLCVNILSCMRCEEALKNAIKLCDENSAIVICGSLYLASEIRPIIKNFFTYKTHKL